MPLLALVMNKGSRRADDRTVSPPCQAPCPLSGRLPGVGLFSWLSPFLLTIFNPSRLLRLVRVLGACSKVKRIPVLPTLLTLGNGVCGFSAIASASKITLDGSLPAADVNWYFLLSAGLILLAMVFDMLDGYAARLVRAVSDFGGQLDSLCDAISFGAAPAF